MSQFDIPNQDREPAAGSRKSLSREAREAARRVAAGRALQQERTRRGEHEIKERERIEQSMDKLREFLKREVQKLDSLVAQPNAFFDAREKIDESMGDLTELGRSIKEPVDTSSFSLATMVFRIEQLVGGNPALRNELSRLKRVQAVQNIEQMIAEEVKTLPEMPGVEPIIPTKDLTRDRIRLVFPELKGLAAKFSGSIATIRELLLKWPDSYGEHPAYKAFDELVGALEHSDAAAISSSLERLTRILAGEDKVVTQDRLKIISGELSATAQAALLQERVRRAEELQAHLGRFIREVGAASPTIETTAAGVQNPKTKPPATGKRAVA